MRVRGAPIKRRCDCTIFAKGSDGPSGAPRTRFFFRVSPRAQIGRREFLENGILICQVSQRAPVGHRELPENGISTSQVLQQAQMGHRELPPPPMTLDEHPIIHRSPWLEIWLKLSASFTSQLFRRNGRCSTALCNVLIATT